MNRNHDNTSRQSATAGKNIICRAYFPKTDTHALVQEENDCVYLYLYIRPESSDTEIRASWVRNYAPAIDAVDEQALQAGLQPRMPLRACRHPKGATRLDPETLRIVFLEDGDGAALYQDDELLAFIPGWASSGEFTGYARDAIGTSPFAWELGTPRQNDVFQRAQQAEAYWKSMQQNTVWEQFRDERLAAIERAYGPHTEYLAIDTGYFPPRAVVIVESEGIVRLFTLGMSLLQQPSVDLYSQHPESLRRAELAMAVDKALFDAHRDTFVAYLVGLSDIPWNYTTFLADGHTVLFDIDPFGKDFTNALLLEGGTHFSQSLYGDFRSDTVNCLWIVPITRSEQQYAEEMGNVALMACARGDRQAMAFRVFDAQDKFHVEPAQAKKQENRHR